MAQGEHTWHIEALFSGATEDILPLQAYEINHRAALSTYKEERLLAIG